MSDLRETALELWTRSRDDGLRFAVFVFFLAVFLLLLDALWSLGIPEKAEFTAFLEDFISVRLYAAILFFVAVLELISFSLYRANWSRTSELITYIADAGWKLFVGFCWSGLGIIAALNLFIYLFGKTTTPINPPTEILVLALLSSGFPAILHNARRRIQKRYDAQ